MIKQALSGIKVVGFVTVAVGPIIVRDLAVNGATCVLVENMKLPNTLRLNSPFKDNIPGMDEAFLFPSLIQINMTCAWT